MKKLQPVLALFFFCVLTAGAQSFEWRHMNSALTTFTHKPGNPDVVFAGDAAGLIRRSDDRGVTWRVVSYQSETAVNAIAFLNENTGFAATSEAGLILMTNDGGNTWTRKQFVDADRPTEVYRFHPAMRIVVADDKTAFFDIFTHTISGPSGRETIVTRDGGATFRIESAPGELYHVSGNTMIAMGREADWTGVAKFTVYKSIDKGATWDTVKISPAGLTSDFSFHGIELALFLSEQEFFITAYKRLSSDKNVYKTTDGGLTFTPLANFPQAKADYLYFKNASEGFAITGNVGGNTTFYTSDGGNTWTPAERNVSTVSHYLGNDTFIAYSNDHTAISTDFGRTWTEQADPINTVRSSMGVPGLHFLQVVDDTVAFASIGKLQSGVYSGRELVRTTDGGLTWHMVADAAGTVYRGEIFHFVSKDTFYFTGTGFKDGGNQGGYLKIKLTTDGGLTSKDLFTGNWWEEIKEFVFIDRNNAVTYSENSATINYTTDGGQNWTSLTTSGKFQTQIEKIVFPHIDSWFAKTTHGMIFRSTDRGQTWTDVTGIANCGTLHFTNATTGYMHGCRQKFYKTTDGGQNWTDLGGGIDEKIKNAQFNVIGFRTPTEGYMSDQSGGSNYANAITTDGGNTWQWYTRSQLGTRIAEIDFADENTGMMMDAFGNVARYVGPGEFTTDTVSISTGVVGVEEHKEALVSVYPNPAGDFIIVQAGDAPVQSVEIRDILGRLRLRFAGGMAGSVRNIETKDLAPGMYIVTVHTGRNSFSQRLNIVR